jgi:hypothetical protein
MLLVALLDDDQRLVEIIARHAGSFMTSGLQRQAGNRCIVGSCLKDSLANTAIIGVDLDLDGRLESCSVFP